MDRLMVISSDGHAMAKMQDYRPYLVPTLRDEFDAFCVDYQQLGLRSVDLGMLMRRTDQEEVEHWERDIVATGRLAGISDPAERLLEMESQGICAEVLFPDFGLPFELSTPMVEAGAGFRRRPDQIRAANMAHNRWLADFCSVAPERFAPLALVNFDEVDHAIKEILWARDAGFKGIVLLSFDETSPLFHPQFDPIWGALEEAEMLVHSHAGTSSTSRYPIATVASGLPNPAVALPIFGGESLFFCRHILNHLVWGGVLERHPNLKVVFTEQGSGWVIAALESMDYSFHGSYLRRDVREVLSVPPSEYFRRQCFLGSSLFSTAEIAARHEIGLGQMMIGIDYPHHEGAWHTVNTEAYLQATFGAAQVPEHEARLLLGETAAALYKLDVDKLTPLIERIGSRVDDVLTQPVEDLFPRGDVHKPLSGALV